MRIPAYPKRVNDGRPAIVFEEAMARETRIPCRGIRLNGASAARGPTSGMVGDYTGLDDRRNYAAVLGE